MSIRAKLSALFVLCVRGRTSFAGREERRQSVSGPPEAPSRYLFFLKSRDEMFLLDQVG